MTLVQPFFPTSRSFWLYHLLGLVGIASIDSATLLMAPHMAAFKVWSSWVLWPPLFTFVVLAFRWCYLNTSLSEKRVAQLVPLVVIYATVSGLLIAATIIAILLPFYWTSFVPQEIAEAGEVNLLKVGFPMVIGAGLSAQLFIMAWSLLYISLFQNRKAREQALRNANLQSSLRDAQMATLQSQLNPHFLFNALNNIRFVIHENAETADRMLTTLSELLRYSLSTAEQNLVTLSRELEMTQRYIDLVKLQYEDKLDYRVTLNIEVSHLMVPPMSVQTLVENAMKHGVEHLPTGGAITVQVQPSASAENWEILVSNPIPHQAGSDPNQAQGTGTGLKNIRHRIDLIYAGNAVLEVQQFASTFSAKLILPMENKG